MGGIGFYLLFCLYIGFFNFVILNTVTSLFVENTILNADQDQQRIIQEELERKDQYVEMLKDWYEKMDSDGSGDISLEEFETRLQDPEMDAFASRMDTQITDVKQFFARLSGQGTRAVDLETFVIGCIKLKGVAKSMDLLDFMHMEKEFNEQQRVFNEMCLAQLQQIAG